jgi:hypothetical protein
VNCAFGAGFAFVLDVPLQYGGAVGILVTAYSAVFGGFMPAICLPAGVFTEVWTGHMNKSFKLREEMVGWYKRIRGYDQYVENDVIHFVNIGGSPKVLVNNTTYPIGISALKDADKPIGLDYFQTERTVVTYRELHAISYDLMGSTIERHRDAISDKIFAKAAHALAPTSNAKEHPVVATTGKKVDGENRLAITHANILKLKKAFDNLRVPNAERVLILCPDHVNDLLMSDQKFAAQYYNYTSGKVANLYGFEVYEYPDCPYYNANFGTKLAFSDEAKADMHTMASVAFAASKAMRADGSLKMFWLKAENNPAMQQNEINFSKYSICLPLGEDCLGAIYSAKP